jgi:hypothetical protein
MYKIDFYEDADGYSDIQDYLVAVQLGHHILNASSKFVPETIGLPFVRG